jgi:hypothetical protein
VNVLANLARVTTATAGTGTLTLGAAVVGWLTFAQAGVATGAVVTYAIEDANGGHEIGQGTYTAAGTTLTRSLIYRSTGAGNTAAISLSGSAQVYITPAAEDLTASFLPLTGGSLSGGLSIRSASSAAMLNVGGAVPGTARSYNAYTDASNGEWAYMGDWLSNVARYGTDKNGTGVARNIQFLVGGVNQLDYGFSAAGYWTSFSPLYVLGGATNSPLIVRTNAGQQSSILFQADTATKFQIGRNSDNSWFMYDSVNASSFLQVNTGGATYLGESSQIQIPKSSGSVLISPGLNVGLTAGTARNYNSFADGANNEFAYMGDWGKTANLLTFGSDKLGTGIARDVSLVWGGTEKLRLTSAGVTLSSPLPIASGGTAAAALAVDPGGGWGLTHTLLQTVGTGVQTISNSTGTMGTGAGGGWLTILAVGLDAQIQFGRTNGTFAAPTAILSGNPLATISVDGSYAGSWDAQYRAAIQAAATENWTATAEGTSWQFITTLTGGIATAVRATIQAGLVVGVPTGGDKGVGTINAVQVYANNVLLTSDARAKQDIDLVPDDCLGLVSRIAPKTYRFKDADWSGRKNWGFLAQDVESEMTRAGHAFGGYVEDKDGRQSLSYSDMIAVLWQAVRELAAREARA